jgi:DNA polymerase V
METMYTVCIDSYLGFSYLDVLPIYIDAGITGFESPSAEYREMELSLDELLIKNPNATFIGVANGHSMEGKGIYDGDLLIVDRAKPIRHMDVVVACYNGNFCCKIIDIKNNRLLSAPLQPSLNYEAVNITSSDVFQIEGSVPFSIRVVNENASVLSCMR